ncbi:MAG: HNH endonuclease [Actinomycetota bacterium]
MKARGEIGNWWRPQLADDHPLVRGAAGADPGRRRNRRFVAAATHHGLDSPTRCFWCEAEVSARSAEATVDHLIPRSRGGANTIDNVVPACTSCNSAKSDTLPAEFLHSSAFRGSEEHRARLAERWPHPSNGRR